MSIIGNNLFDQNSDRNKLKQKLKQNFCAKLDCRPKAQKAFCFESKRNNFIFEKMNPQINYDTLLNYDMSRFEMTQDVTLAQNENGENNGKCEQLN